MKLYDENKNNEQTSYREVYRRTDGERTAIISITDFNGEFAKLINTPRWLHQVSFDDVDNDVMIDEVGGKPTEEKRLAI